MKNFIRKLDLVSDGNKIYYEGEDKRQTLMGGIFTILAYGIVVACLIYFGIDFIERTSPTSYFFKQFIPDAGTFPADARGLNSMFHYFQVLDENDNALKDDTVFMVTGANSYALNYFGEPGKDFNLLDEETWIYDSCEERDKGMFKNAINDPQFLQSFCIKKFYNPQTKKVYNQDEPGFRYPAVEHGTGCKGEGISNIGYSLQLLKCIDYSFRPGITCKPMDQINDYIEKNMVRVKLGMMDHDFDVTKYKDPVIHYINDIKNDVRGESVTNNNLNFVPVLVTTDEGIVFESIVDRYSYKLDLNEKLTYDKTQAPYVLSGWAFFMGNKQETYTRAYQRFQDYLAEVGGVHSLLILCAEVLNFVFSQFATFTDMKELCVTVANSITEKGPGRYEGTGLLSSNVGIRLKRLGTNIVLHRASSISSQNKEEGGGAEEEEDDEEKGNQNEEEKNSEKVAPKVIPVKTQPQQKNKVKRTSTLSQKEIEDAVQGKNKTMKIGQDEKKNHKLNLELDESLEEKEKKKTKKEKKKAEKNVPIIKNSRRRKQQVEYEEEEEEEEENENENEEEERENKEHKIKREETRNSQTHMTFHVRTNESQVSESKTMKENNEAVSTNRKLGGEVEMTKVKQPKKPNEQSEAENEQNSDQKMSEVCKTIISLSMLPKTSFCKYICGKYLCEKEEKEVIERVENFYTKIVSEENLMGLSAQMSLLTIRVKTIEDSGIPEIS